MKTQLQESSFYQDVDPLVSVPRLLLFTKKIYIVSSKPGVGHSHWLTTFKPKTECLTFVEEFQEGFDMNLPMEELNIGIHSLTEIAIGKQLIVCLRDFLNSWLSISH